MWFLLGCVYGAYLLLVLNCELLVVDLFWLLLAAVL